jgi:hypothetical protein
MRVHHLRAALPHESGDRTDHPGVRDRWVVRVLSVSIKRVEESAPPSDPVHWDVPVEFGPGATRPGERDNFNFMTAPGELMSEQADVQIAPTYERRGVAVRGLKYAHQPVTSSRRFFRNEMWLVVGEVEDNERTAA